MLWMNELSLDDLCERYIARREFPHNIQWQQTGSHWVKWSLDFQDTYFHRTFVIQLFVSGLRLWSWDILMSVSLGGTVSNTFHEFADDWDKRVTSVLDGAIFHVFSWWKMMCKLAGESADRCFQGGSCMSLVISASSWCQVEQIKLVEGDCWWHSPRPGLMLVTHTYWSHHHSWLHHQITELGSDLVCGLFQSRACA